MSVLLPIGSSILSLPAGAGSFTIPAVPSASTGDDTAIAPNFTAVSDSRCPYRPRVTAVIENRLCFANGWDQPWYWNNSSGFYDLGSTKPTTGSAADNASGSTFTSGLVVDYYLVFRNTTLGRETAPQAISHTMSATKDIDVTWTASDAEADMDVAALYRRLQDTGLYVLVAETAVATATYTDSEGDDLIRLRRAYVRRFRETPPPVALGIVTYKNRLVLWTGEDSNLHFGQISRPDGESVVDDFPSTAMGSNGGILQIAPNEADVIRACIAKGRYLYVFKRSGVYVVDGEDGLNFFVEPLFGAHGALNPRCVIEVEGATVFLDRYGLMYTDLSGQPYIAGASGADQETPLAPTWKRMNLASESLFSLHYSKTEGLVYVNGVLDHDVEPVPIAVYEPATNRFVSKDTGVPSFAMGTLEGGRRHDVRVDELGLVWEQDIGNTDGLYAGDGTGTVTSVLGYQGLTCSAAVFGTVTLTGAYGTPLERYSSAGAVLLQSRAVGSITSTALYPLHWSSTTPSAGDTLALGVRPFLALMVKTAFRVASDKRVRVVIFEHDVETGTLKVEGAFDDDSFTNLDEIDVSANEGKSIVPVNLSGRRFAMRVSMRYSGHDVHIQAWEFHVRVKGAYRE